MAVLWDSLSRLSWQAAEAAARERGLKLHSLEMRDAGEIEDALKAAKDSGAGALLVFASGLLIRSAPRLVELAARNRLPAMYELRLYVEAGGLISYSADLNENWRRAAVFVDKILKGAKPDDLPVEQCRKFEEDLYKFVEVAHDDVYADIRAKKALDKDLEAKVKKTLDEFKIRFVKENAPAVKANA